jgi:hypothetical protein
MRRSENMQQVKTFTTGIFEGEARDQVVKDSKKMAKADWRMHSIQMREWSKNRHTRQADELPFGVCCVFSMLSLNGARY